MGNFHWGLAFRVGGGAPTMSRAGGGGVLRWSSVVHKECWSNLVLNLCFLSLLVMIKSTWNSFELGLMCLVCLVGLMCLVGPLREILTGRYHRGQRTNISHSETVGREGGTRFLEPNLAFAYFDIISSF